MLTIYVLDFGLILKSKKKASYFALNDKMSVMRKLQKVDQFNVKTLSTSIINKCVDKDTCKQMNDYLSEFGQKHSIQIIDMNEVLEITKQISKSQQKIFMIVA